MKQIYQPYVDRFILDQGGMYRYFNRRWWILANGYWSVGGRPKLEHDLTGYMSAFAPPILMENLNQASLNQIFAFLARKLGCTALPGRYQDPGGDERMLHPTARPRSMASDRP